MCTLVMMHTLQRDIVAVCTVDAAVAVADSSLSCRLFRTIGNCGLGGKKPNKPIGDTHTLQCPFFAPCVLLGPCLLARFFHCNRTVTHTHTLVARCVCVFASSFSALPRLSIPIALLIKVRQLKREPEKGRKESNKKCEKDPVVKKEW